MSKTPTVEQIAEFKAPFEGDDKARALHRLSTIPDDLLPAICKIQLWDRVTLEQRSPGAWVVVCDGGAVLNGDRIWEWEPSPSNRSDDFIERTRFDLLGAAEAAYEWRALVAENLRAARSDPSADQPPTSTENTSQ